jgi:hypothetical protein
VSDGGFEDELNALYEHGHRVFLIRLSREGCDFGTDSRKYLNRPDYYLYNNGELLNTVNTLVNIMELEGAL